MNSELELVDHQNTLYNSKNPTRRWLHCTRRDLIYSIINRYSEKNHDRALEVGPGSGVYLSTLSEVYNEVIAIDVEVAYLRNLERKMRVYPNLNLIVDDITNSKLQDGSFDFILCSEVLEHIRDDESAIHGMHRLLKPGGILVLSTPQRWSTLELTAAVALMPGIIKIVRLIYGESILENGHINLKTEKDVIRQLKDAGFLVIEHYKSGMYLPLIAEFMGEFGLRIAQWLESILYGRKLDWLLWTQYYIAEALAVDPNYKE